MNIDRTAQRAVSFQGHFYYTSSEHQFAFMFIAKCFASRIILWCYLGVNCGMCFCWIYCGLAVEIGVYLYRLYCCACIDQISLVKLTELVGSYFWQNSTGIRILSLLWHNSLSMEWHIGIGFFDLLHLLSVRWQVLLKSINTKRGIWFNCYIFKRKQFSLSFPQSLFA